MALLGASPALAVDWDGFYAGIVAGGGLGSAQTSTGSSGGDECLVAGTRYEIVGTQSSTTQWFYRPAAGGAPVQNGPIGTSFQRDLLDDLDLTVLTSGKVQTVSAFGTPVSIIYDEYLIAPGATPKALRFSNTNQDRCTVWHTGAADYLENGTAVLGIPYLGGAPTASSGDVVSGPSSPGGSTRIGGIAGGVRVGYLREFGGFVLGAEGEVLVAGIGDAQAGIGPFGMISARFGYELEGMPVLLFTSIGPAFGQLKEGGSAAMGFGVSAGAGAEYQLEDGLSLRAETRLVDLRNADGSMHASAMLGLLGVSKKL